MDGVISFVKDIFLSILARLGLLNKTGKISLLGLENAGKTTLMHRVKTGEMTQYPPTERPHDEHFKIGTVDFHCHDLGGHESVRYLWDQYCQDMDAVVFMVDAADDERLSECKEELKAVLTMMKKGGNATLVLYNKVDLPHAMTKEKLDEEFADVLKDGKHVKSFVCSVKNMIGYEDGFKWLAKHL
eukprot:TRINITY_DN60237_c1_g1_i1.p2 TRINITY_DN60237_c1_g1~~TRINITY_DN60237_c1_g1_i1.p2  ORF type:complete len:199 (-),score=53.84 TRINITY_DN60237_c1_g1_i1:1522-2079(-)